MTDLRNIATKRIVLRVPYPNFGVILVKIFVFWKYVYCIEIVRRTKKNKILKKKVFATSWRTYFQWSLHEEYLTQTYLFRVAAIGSLLLVVAIGSLLVATAIGSHRFAVTLLVCLLALVVGRRNKDEGGVVIVVGGGKSTRCGLVYLL